MENFSSNEYLLLGLVLEKIEVAILLQVERNNVKSMWRRRALYHHQLSLSISG